MKIKNLSFLSLALLFMTNLKGQSKSSDTLSFNIVQAMDYAVANNPLYKNAIADVAYAEQQVKEVTAIGIPQIRGQVQFQDALQKQVFVFPVNGVPTPIRVGNKYTTQASLNASWLMLDGTYFLGLKAAKEFTELSKKIAFKTEADLKIDVAKTYFLALITLENSKLINENRNTLNTIYLQTKELNKEGFVEALEVDRLKLQLNNIDITKQKIDDQFEIVLGLLKTKMGISPEKPIKLSDNITDINKKFILSDTSDLVVEKRADYAILKQQLLLNEYDIKRYQFGKYPNLVGAFSYVQTNFGETLDFGKWYDNYFYALQLNVPIFSGFANDAKIQKAKIQKIKTENTISNVTNLMKLEAIQAKIKVENAQSYVDQQKENLDLANRIFDITSIKYKEGVGSNLELTTANQDVKTAQTNYLTALYDLLIAKIDYHQALGILPKLN